MVGEHGVEEERDVPEEVVEDVRFDDVVELLGLAYPVRHRDPATRQQGEKRHFRDQARHGDDFPARRLAQPGIDVIEARDVIFRAQ